MRQIVLDTETTGLDYSRGHRVIEIGCIELVNRRITQSNFHQYINPEREIEEGAMAVHGITNEFLLDKPRFEEIVQAFIEFIGDSELIIHNAPFDVGFLNHEIHLVQPDYGKLTKHCKVFDTLKQARQLFPGQKNNLDALSKRYEIKNFDRSLHGALLDAEILAHVYLAMTGGQRSLFAEDTAQTSALNTAENNIQHRKTPIIQANTEEQEAHQRFIELLNKKSDRKCVWEE
ncbi:MAG: DNA polymerase III subunit epsilon [Gammaproteobacteria bacterium]|nr:DNA polymerase III subunit epsilon [Gammaproteobacteria bacterium]MBU1558702.1 DNA polymerase III subunit epsilon [Gammaproteobacteria bacterium]MBU1926181.1 DNA polymerase III subunit epsilon [Gammaproteobacteria bacterium]MBU2545539.1 DNA polymerase III subunit epsilon [Gammaproteobacteria bacterium]